MFEKFEKNSDPESSLEPIGNEGNATKQYSRRDFLRLLLTLSHSKATYVLLKTLNLLPQQFTFGEGKSSESTDYLTNWDLDWGENLASSFSDLVKILSTYKDESSLPSGEIIKKIDIFKSWVLVQALGLELREKFTVGMPLEVIGRYMTASSSGEFENRLDLIESPFNGEMAWLLEVGSLRDIIGAAIISTQDWDGQLFRKASDRNSLLFRRFNVKVDYGAASKEGLVGERLVQFEENYADSNGINFPFWFGRYESPVHDDLAYILGRNTSWNLSRPKDSTRNGDLIRDLAEVEYRLRISLDRNQLGTLSFNGEFSAASKPLDGLDFKYFQLAAKMRRVLAPILFQASRFGLTQENILTYFDNSLQSGARELYAEFIRDGLMTLSPLDWIEEDSGETWKPAMGYVRVTNKFMQILEKLKLAKPLTISGEYEFFKGKLARQGYVDNQENPLLYELNYDYHFGGDSVWPEDLSSRESL